MRPSNPSSRYTFETMKNRHPHKNLHTNGHSSVIQNGQDVDTNQPEYPLTHERMNNMDSNPTMEYYSEQ